MKKTLTISAAAIAAALAGCSAATEGGSSATSSMPGMTHGSSGKASSPAPAASAGFNNADTMLAQMMIQHHAQAVKMSDTMLTKEGIPAPVTDLATRIKAAQGPEIEKMTGWLKSWGSPPRCPLTCPRATACPG